jgi:hypothetical protein
MLLSSLLLPYPLQPLLLFLTLLAVVIGTAVVITVILIVVTQKLFIKLKFGYEIERQIG